MSYLTWGYILPQIFFVGQLLLAAILGALVGWQREVRGKAAGARTYALVSAGACLFTVISLYGFSGLADSDPTRIASQVVVGIGFLGAGAILQRKNRVLGLTTAAGLWMSAAIGVAVGVHMYILAVVAALLILAVLMINEEKIVHGENEDEDEE